MNQPKRARWLREEDELITKLWLALWTDREIAVALASLPQNVERKASRSPGAVRVRRQVLGLTKPREEGAHGTEETSSGGTGVGGVES